MSDPAARRPRVGSVILSIGAFAAAFACTCAAVRALVPPFAWKQTDVKLAYLERNAREIDTLFLGSSRVLRDFVPSVFDAQCAERGLTVRSFNLGIGGLEGFEADFLLRRVLAIRGLELEHVLIEPLPPEHRLEEANLDSLRVVDWHTFLQTRRAVVSSWRSADPIAARLASIRHHLELFAKRQTSHGLGRFAAAQLFGSARQELERVLAESWLREQRGYGEQDESEIDQRERFAEMSDERVRAILTAMMGRNAESGSLSVANADVERRQVAYLRVRGLEPVFVLTPTAHASARALALERERVLPPLLRFDRPLVFPALYSRSNRHDMDHLNREGALVFTRLLAASFARAVEREPR